MYSRGGFVTLTQNPSLTVEMNFQFFSVSFSNHVKKKYLSGREGYWTDDDGKNTYFF
jgi:hypothetical protein